MNLVNFTRQGSFGIDWSLLGNKRSSPLIERTEIRILKIVEYNAEMFDKNCRLLVDCLNTLYDEEYDYPQLTKYVVFLEKLTLDKNSKIILAKEDDKLLGFAYYTAFTDIAFVKLSIKIHLIHVISHRRGQGIGTKLLEYCKEILKNSDGFRIELETNKDNPSNSLYRKLDFEFKEDLNVYHYFK
jgi:ribosomal protein S18 acetylase RimI-like enzyme